MHFTLSLTALAAIAPMVMAQPTARFTNVSTTKRGLGYTSSQYSNYFNGFPSITWGYNWGFPSNGLSTSLEYVGMLWGNPTGNQGYITNWNNYVATASQQGTKHLLAFNEPDINNLSPQDAATAWKTFMEPHRGTYQLGAPAVTNGGGATGLAWLQSFLNACSGCTLAFVPLHWYNNYDQVADFANHVQQAHSVAGNRPLWITEFQGTNGNDAQQIQFIKTVVPWLDSLSYVARYAYFGACNPCSLVNSNNNGISDIGTEFATISNVNGTTPTSLVH